MLSTEANDQFVNGVRRWLSMRYASPEKFQASAANTKQRFLLRELGLKPHPRPAESRPFNQADKTGVRLPHSGESAAGHHCGVHNSKVNAGIVDQGETMLRCGFECVIARTWHR